MCRGVKIPWIRGSIYHGVGGRYFMDRGVKIPWVGGINPLNHGISNPLPMIYRPPYPWYIDPLSMVYQPPNPWYFDLLCPWNIDPPTYGISNPLLCYYELLSFGRNEGGLNLPWGGSKYNDKKLTPGSKYHMENWTQGQNIMKIDPGVNLPYYYLNIKI